MTEYNINLQNLNEDTKTWLGDQLRKENNISSHSTIDLTGYVNKLIENKKDQEEEEEVIDKSNKYLAIGIPIFILSLMFIVIPISGMNSIYRLFISITIFTLVLILFVLLLLRFKPIGERFDNWNISSNNSGSIVTLNGTVIMGVLVFLSFSPVTIADQGGIPFLGLDKSEATGLIRSLTASIIFQFVVSTIFVILVGDSVEQYYKRAEARTNHPKPNWGYKLGVIFATLGFVFLSFTMFLVGISSL